MRVVVTGGGTGGHVTPLKPVIDELKLLDSSVEVMYVGQKGDQFADFLQVGTDVDKIELISAGKYRRYPDEPLLKRLADIKTHALNMRDLFKIGAGVAKSFRILSRFKPDVVFGNGGFVSVPVGWAASIHKIPLLIHESDALPGVANKILSSKASKIVSGMPTEQTTLKGKPVEFVGIPLRNAFLKKEKYTKKELKAKLGFDSDKPLITISGGSLGAEGINNAVLANIKNLLEITQIAHITGERNLKTVEDAAAAAGVDGDSYQAIAFTNSIDAYFKASDLVITRASATTFSELAALSKPCIFVLSKKLADQVHNAKVASDRGAAEVIEESNLQDNPELLLNRISELLQDRPALDNLGQAIAKLAKPDAAKDIARIISNMAKKNG